MMKKPDLLKKNHLLKTWDVVMLSKKEDAMTKILKMLKTVFMKLLIAKVPLIVKENFTSLKFLQDICAKIKEIFSSVSR